jgi:hypothetical protein
MKLRTKVQNGKREDNVAVWRGKVMKGNERAGMERRENKLM